MRFASPFFAPAAVAAYWTSEEIGTAAKVAPNAVRDNWPYLARALTDWGINRPRVCIGVIGTIMTETGSFYPVREAHWLPEADRWAYYADTTKHAPYAGGPLFHGRGYVQTTHIGNYQKVADAIGVDVVSNPDLLLQPEYAAKALAVYWTTHAAGALIQKCEERNWGEVRRLVFGQPDLAGATRIQEAANTLAPLAMQRGFAV
jgi:predicted chitinase